MTVKLLTSKIEEYKMHLTFEGEQHWIVFKIKSLYVVLTEIIIIYVIISMLNMMVNENPVEDSG